MSCLTVPRNRRPLNEPSSNPSIFGQILSFEIFTQSESMGSTHWRRKHKKFRGRGTGVVFARPPGLRKYKVFRAIPKKADERGGGGGGTPINFFRTISGHHLHYWVGVPSVHNTDLRGDKQKKKKKKK